MLCSTSLAIELHVSSLHGSADGVFRIAVRLHMKNALLLGLHTSVRAFFASQFLLCLKRCHAFKQRSVAVFLITRAVHGAFRIKADLECVTRVTLRPDGQIHPALPGSDVCSCETPRLVSLRDLLRNRLNRMRYRTDRRCLVGVLRKTQHCECAGVLKRTY